MMATPTLGAARAAGHSRAPWDPWLLGAAVALLALGLVMVHSASIAFATRTSGHGSYYLVRHAIYVVTGVLCLLVALRVRIRVWELGGPYLLLGGIALLTLVLLPGISAHINGSARWIKLGIVTLQPAELMKLFMVVYVAGYLVRKQEELKNFTQGIAMVSLVVAFTGTLLLLQPDLGTVVVITATVLTLLFLGGVRFWHFLLVLAAGLGAVVLLTFISPYRMNRVTSFLDPWSDPFNRGFQLVQALIAVGRGEWFGVGLGASVQKLSYLPAAHTDFIFAVLAEELGLLGVLAVLALYAVVMVRAFLIARQAEGAGQIYGARLAQGLGLLLGYQAMINIGVNLGLLPTKGLTLPFVSYGGSSMLVCCLALGMLLRVERETRGALIGARTPARSVFA